MNDRKKTRPLAPPEGTDRDWERRVAVAREAKEQGRRARAGKPGSFRSAVGRA